MVTRILATCLLAGGLAAASAAYADDTPATSPGAAVATNGHNDKGGQKRIDTQIDRLSTKVDLTSDQKDQLRSQLAKSNQNTQKLWQQFANTHVQVIKLEAEMTAALEDVLAPEQKTLTKKNRDAKADSDSSTAHAAKKSDSTPATASAKKPMKNETANKSKATDKSATSPTDAKPNLKKSGDSTKVAKQKSSSTGDRSDDQDETEEYVWTMVIVPAQEELNPLGLSAEQEQQTDQIFYNYHSKIVKGWQKIDQLHDQLVAMEAQSILDVEKVLTQDQRQKLMDMRKKSSVKKDSSKPKTKSKG